MRPCDYSNHIKTVTNPETGQQEFKYPQHPLARKDGMVLLSRHLMSIQVGHWLHPGEIVIYRDGNPQNLIKENLELTTLTKLAHGLRCNSVILVCPFCGLPFKVPPSLKTDGSITMRPVVGWHHGNSRLIRRNCARWSGKSPLPRLLACMVFRIKRLKSAAVSWVFPNLREVIGPDLNRIGFTRRRNEPLSLPN